MEKEKFLVKSKKFKGNSSVISLRMSDELIAKLDSISKESGRPRNEIITMAIEYAIDNLEIK